MHDRELEPRFELDEAGPENVAEKRPGRLKSLLGGVAMGTAWASVGEVLMNDSKFTISSGVLLGVVAYNQLRKNSFRSISQSVRNHWQVR